MARKLAQFHLHPASLIPSKDNNLSTSNTSAGTKPTHSTASTISSNESSWRRWILAETVRRTLFLTNIINTLSCRTTKQNPYFYETLDDNLILDMPLPAPDSLWKAKSADEWALAKRTLAAEKAWQVSARDLLDWFQNGYDDRMSHDDYDEEDNIDTTEDHTEEDDEYERRQRKARYRNDLGRNNPTLKKADTAASIEFGELPQFTRLI